MQPVPSQGSLLHLPLCSNVHHSTSRCDVQTNSNRQSVLLHQVSESYVATVDPVILNSIASEMENSPGHKIWELDKEYLLHFQAHYPPWRSPRIVQRAWTKSHWCGTFKVLSLLCFFHQSLEQLRNNKYCVPNPLPGEKRPPCPVQSNFSFDKNGSCHFCFLPLSHSLIGSTDSWIPICVSRRSRSECPDSEKIINLSDKGTHSWRGQERTMFQKQLT